MKIVEDIAEIAINEYLKIVVKNNTKCQHCTLGFEDNEKNHICFFAGECVAHDFNHFHFSEER